MSKQTNGFFRAKQYRIEEGRLYIDGNLIAENFVFTDEENGIFEATRVSDNRYINGQQITGVVVSHFRISKGPTQ